MQDEFFSFENPAVQFGAVLSKRKSYRAVRCCDACYGAVRYDFVKLKILRCRSVRFSKVVNGMVRFGAFMYPTVRFGAVFMNQESFGAVRCGYQIPGI